MATGVGYGLGTGDGEVLGEGEGVGEGEALGAGTGEGDGLGEGNAAAAVAVLLASRTASSRYRVPAGMTARGTVKYPLRPPALLLPPNCRPRKQQRCQACVSPTAAGPDAGVAATVA